MKDWLNSREAAERIGTTPRELRVFLRSAAGKAHVTRDEHDSYVFAPDDIPAITEAFTAWATKREAERAAKRAAKKESK
ncbi:hypothetical protein [Rhodococcus pyridinivorans]|uniref:hypothetical protein n=1 Tax=Rhodococcus pyridinivorans TaxID=103816 RepID=UPI003AAB67E6